VTDTQTMRDQRKAEQMFKAGQIKLVHNPEAEHAVLVALCQDPDRSAWITCTREAVSDMDFGTKQPYHRHAYRCIATLHGAGAPIAPATLLSELRRTADPKQPFNLEELVKLLYAAPPTPHLVENLRELKRAGVARRTQIECMTLIQSAHVMDHESLSSRLNAISQDLDIGSAQEAVSLAADGGRLGAHWRGVLEHHANPKGQLNTGIPSFDRMWAGSLIGGRYYMLGGPPKSGKTKLATWMAWHYYAHRSAVIDWFSVEMTFEMTVCALMGSGWGLTMDQAFNLEPTLADQRRYGGDFQARCALAETVAQRRQELITMPGDFHHRMVGGDVTCEHIVAQIQRRHIEREATGDRRPYLAIVDFLQDVPSGKRGLDERMEISATSTMLRSACKHFKIPILGIFHTQEANPTKAFGSSKLSKDADVFNTIEGQEDSPGERWLKTILSRHHMPTPALRLGADLSCARFNPEQKEH